MEKLFNYLRRCRADIDEKKRVTNLLRNSNSFGTTANLSRQQPHRILTGNLLEFTELKKDSLVTTVNPYNNN